MGARFDTAPQRVTRNPSPKTSNPPDTMANEPTNLPAPTDPTPRWTPLELELASKEKAVVRNDGYSDRIRCDHPDVRDGEALGNALIQAANTSTGRTAKSTRIIPPSSRP